MVKQNVQISWVGRFPGLAAFSPGLLLLAALLAGSPTGAAEAPAPSGEPIPVVAGRAALELAQAQATQAGRGLVADLSLGHAGQMVRAPAATPLAPGRYRLHALVATTPHGNLLVDAVALRLAVGGRRGQFERQDAFATPGQLAPVFFDFTVDADTATPLQIEASWLVGDTMLDRQRYRHEDEARRAYRAQRQNAINQLALKGGPAVDLAPGAAVAAPVVELAELEAEAAPGYRPVSLTDAKLPDYRLLLAGLAIEPLTPVGLVAVRTDQNAYAPGTPGRATVELRNWAAEAVAVRLEWGVEDADAGGQLRTPQIEQLELGPGQVLVHPLAEPFATAGIELLGRVQVRATVGDLRPVEGGIPFVILPPPRPEAARDRRIFAHYMGCFPVGSGPCFHHRQRGEPEGLKHESRDPAWRRGGHIRNWDLCPPTVALTAEQSADLEIRRALRIGIDGFAVDAWAGGDDAKRSTQALFKVALEKDYPFTITLCIDPACGGTLVETVRWLLDQYGDHPKLARRNGKPLIFGYFSTGPAFAFADRQLGAKTEADRRRVRTTPLGWHLAGLAFRDAERRVGQPIFYHFSAEWLFHPFGKGDIPEHGLRDALGIIAQHVDAVGSFNHLPDSGELAAAVRAAGAEWSGASGMYQKENIPFETYVPLGSEWFNGSWHGLREQQATLPQLITWNDYGENTNIAPGWDTRYTLYDLTGYQIEWWKTGRQPAAGHDRVYLIYAKYPRGATVWPFAEGERRPRNFEVLTILTAPATVRLPGRDIEFEAPAGYSTRQFPLTVGPVVAELLRAGQVVMRLDAPEPITDRPFRESNAMVCYSSEFDRHWRADFGDAKPFRYGEYADDDGDGLPNWFEMYWFSRERNFKPVASTSPDLLLEGAVEHPVSRWLDFSTMTLIDPDADPDGDGLTNLQEYLGRSDPTSPAPPAAAATPLDGLADPPPLQALP